MCMSLKYLLSIMNVRCRRFSLDSSVSVDNVSVLDRRRSSSRFTSKKSKDCKSLDDARLTIQELNESLYHNACPREMTIVEENVERLDEFINTSVSCGNEPTENDHLNLQRFISFLKYNKTFHKLFQEIPERENLTHNFICAIQKEVLYHGRLFVSENYVCFHSSVLLKDTKVVIAASSVREVKKHNSALSMLSVQTCDGEKYTFVSLRNRDMCYKLLHSICPHLQGKCGSHSPHLSSAENEADPDTASSYSSLEDSVDRDLSRQNSIYLDSFPQMSSEAPTRHNSLRQNSLIDEDDAVSWIWRITGVRPLFFLREMRDFNGLFYVYVVLMVLLLMVSVYISLRIMALEEQLTELSFQHRVYKQT